MANGLQWMPLYVADYLADTGHLSTVEHGAYLLLIMHYWQNHGLPDSDQKLARISRMPLKEWTAIRDTIAELFGENWNHARIDSELKNAHEMVAKRSAAGKAGASARYGYRMAIAVQTNRQLQSQEQIQDSEKNFGKGFRALSETLAAGIKARQ